MKTFEAFTNKANIRKFDAKKLPVVGKRSGYNDDLNIEHFQSSSRHYAGEQRMGVVYEHLECLSLLDHVGQALHIPSFCP